MDKIIKLPGGTVILLKATTPTADKTSWREVAGLVLTVFLCGFACYILLALHVEGLL